MSLQELISLATSEGIKLAWIKATHKLSQSFFFLAPLVKQHLLLFSHWVLSAWLWPDGLQHARLSCPSLSLGVCENSCPLSQWYYQTIPSSVTPCSSCLQSFPVSGSFLWVSSSCQVAKGLELQHQSFQWMFRVDFLLDWLVWSSCCLRDSQESSPAPQLESINSSVLFSLLYDPTLTSVLEQQ